MVVVFQPHFKLSVPSLLGGRPSKLRTHQEMLGLLMHFYVTSMDQQSLCMVFGLPPGTLSRYLTRAEHVLHKALAGCHEARPSPRRQVTLARLVEEREPLLRYTFGFIDGKHFMVCDNW